MYEKFLQVCTAYVFLAYSSSSLKKRIIGSSHADTGTFGAYSTALLMFLLHNRDDEEMI